MDRAVSPGKNCRVAGRRSESMRWEDLEQSGNIEDRRGEQGGGYGGGGGFPIGGGGLGIGAIVVLGLIGWVTGIDPRLLIGGAEIFPGGGSGNPRMYPPAPRDQPRRTGAPSGDIGGLVS